MVKGSVVEPMVGSVYYDRELRCFRRLVEMRQGSGRSDGYFGTGYLFSLPAGGYEEAKKDQRPYFCLCLELGFSPREVSERFALITPDNLPEFTRQVVWTEEHQRIREENQKEWDKAALAVLAPLLSRR